MLLLVHRLVSALQRLAGILGSACGGGGADSGSVPIAAEEREGHARMVAELEELRSQRDRAIFEQVQPSSLAWTPGLAALIFDVWRQDQERVGAILAEATPAEVAPVVKAAPHDRGRSNNSSNHVFARISIQKL